ncbi:amidohydrolase family protein [Microbulbifer pacificus]|uniref:amidohydrolase family protein n=1 Tax=Microbulbifer pacificus TaxID=407164 RepID=UPI001F194A57|nr:amidohydrolase family protein [Microbulbifer pacificus]
MIQAVDVSDIEIRSQSLFDAHFHIIDERYPLIANNGYLPAPFSYADYLSRVSSYNLCGGAVVSGSFQAFDQSYLLDALEKLGPSFVGVTQLPHSVSDSKIIRLNDSGVRAVRFNLKRGGSEGIGHLKSLAARVFEIVGWHVELYVDSEDLDDLYDVLASLPAVSIDHLGLSKRGFGTLTRLAENNVKIKATGFGRVDFPVRAAIRDLYSANPDSLMFGTDLPSTRAPRKYSDEDFLMLFEVLDPDGVKRVLSENAIRFYRPAASHSTSISSNTTGT